MNETTKQKEYNMNEAIIGAIGSILGNVINTQQVNKANQQLTAQTNAANIAMVREQNKAAALEAEKAYQRSLPTNQVANMMSAGMSRAGALNAISGGGSYTPAPVNVAQSEAPQIQGVDFSTLANVGMAISAQKSQEKMHAKNLKLEHDKLEFEKKKWNDEASNRAEILSNLIKQGNLLSAQARKLDIETNIEETNAEILALTKEDKVNAENAENLARKVRAENQKYIEDVRAKGLKNIDESTFKQLIASITEREAVATTLEMFGLYLREKGSSAAGSLLKEFAAQSASLGSPLTSINP